MTTDIRRAPPIAMIALPDGTTVYTGPDFDIPQWWRDRLAREQSTTALSSRELRRRLQRELRRQAKHEGPQT
jgi:hypothetical protein